MEMLGHTTPTVAMIYQAAGAQRMKAIANRLDDQWAQVSPRQFPTRSPRRPDQPIRRATAPATLMRASAVRLRGASNNPPAAGRRQRRF